MRYNHFLYDIIIFLSAYLRAEANAFSYIYSIKLQECTEIGFFRSEQDCTAFYRCVDFYNIGKFTKFDFVCPEGLVFDETLR